MSLAWTPHATPLDENPTGGYIAASCYADDIAEWAIAGAAPTTLAATSPDTSTWTEVAGIGHHNGTGNNNDRWANDIKRCTSWAMYIIGVNRGLSACEVVGMAGHPFGALSGSADSFSALAVKEGSPPLVMVGGRDGNSSLCLSKSNDKDTDAWTPFSSPWDDGFVLALDYSPANDRWLVAGSDPLGNILVGYSDDDGDTWTTVTVPVDGYVSKVYWDALNGKWYICGNDAAETLTLIVSNDNGATWSVVPNPFDGGRCASIAVGPDRIVAVGNNADYSITVIESTDGTATWDGDAPAPFDTGSNNPSCVSTNGDGDWAIGGDVPSPSTLFASTIGGSPPEPPTNDDFADAILLEGDSGSVDWDNTAATAETPDPLNDDHESATTVWWKFIPASDGSATLSTSESGDSPIGDTILAVYTGEDLSSLTEVAFDDDTDEGSYASVTLDVTEGSTYYVAVAGFDSSEGTFTLSWELPVPPPPPEPPPAPTFTRFGLDLYRALKPLANV